MKSTQLPLARFRERPGHYSWPGRTRASAPLVPRIFAHSHPRACPREGGWGVGSPREGLWGDRDGSGAEAGRLPAHARTPAHAPASLPPAAATTSSACTPPPPPRLAPQLGANLLGRNGHQPVEPQPAPICWAANRAPICLVILHRQPAGAGRPGGSPVGGGCEGGRVAGAGAGSQTIRVGRGAGAPAGLAGALKGR
jgi:hypothetical protein